VRGGINAAGVVNWFTPGGPSSTEGRGPEGGAIEFKVIGGGGVGSEGDGMGGVASWTTGGGIIGADAGVGAGIAGAGVGTGAAFGTGASLTGGRGGLIFNVIDRRGSSAGIGAGVAELLPPSFFAFDFPFPVSCVDPSLDFGNTPVAIFVFQA
jgi:hypothetical protein